VHLVSFIIRKHVRRFVIQTIQNINSWQINIAGGVGGGGNRQNALVVGEVIRSGVCGRWLCVFAVQVGWGEGKD
jgi:hypothetical protein